MSTSLHSFEKRKHIVMTQMFLFNIRLLFLVALLMFASFTTSTAQCSVSYGTNYDPCQNTSAFVPYYALQNFSTGCKVINVDGSLTTSSTAQLENNITSSTTSIGVKWLTPGQHYVDYKCPCESTNRTQIINVAPTTVSVGSISSPTICATGSTTLTATGISSGAYVYQWEKKLPGDTWSNATVINHYTNVLPSEYIDNVTKDYRIKVANACAAAVYANATVTVLPVPPTPSNTDITNECDIVNSISVSTSYPSGYTIKHYYYDVNNSLLAQPTASFNGSFYVSSYTPTAFTGTKTFRVEAEVSNTGICSPMKSAVKSFNYSVSPTPSPPSGLSITRNGSAVSTINLCAGEAITLSSVQSDATMFTWKNPSNYDIGTGNTLSNYVPTASGLYKVFATWTNSCQQSFQIQGSVQINISDPAVSIPSLSSVLCSGTSDGTFQSSLPPGAVGVSYQWSFNGTPGSASTYQLPSNLTAGNYTIYLTASATFPSACLSSRVMNTSMNFTVEQTPPVPSALGTSVFGAQVMTLTAQVATPTYRWVRAGQADFNNTNYVTPETITVDKTAYVTLVARAANTCESSKAIDLDIMNVPVIAAGGGSTYLAIGGSISLATTESYESYSWLKPSGVTAATATIAATEVGTYQVTVTKNGATGVANIAIKPGLSEQNINHIIENTILVTNIKSTSAVDALPIGSRAQSLQYLDGLGRPMQTIVTQGSPSKLDIIQPNVYDANGREARKYLPFTSGNISRFVLNSDVIDTTSGDYKFGGIAASFYDSPSSTVADDDLDVPFAETIFEPSPLNRILEQASPGVWKSTGINSYTSPDNTVKFDYKTNTTNDNVRKWTISAPTATYPFGIITSTENYAAGKLSVRKTKDENGKEVIEYIDNEGKILLKRVQAVSSQASVTDALYASTYYIYNIHSQLVYVIQPEGSKLLVDNPSAYFPQNNAVKEQFIAKWVFRYRYDGKQRMILKQVPGADSVRMVYDQRDRLVLTQDGNQRGIKNWLFTKYDQLNRPVLTGVLVADSLLTQSKMQRRVNSYYQNLGSNGGSFYETFVGNAAGNILGYTNSAYPTGVDPTSVFTTTYYDTYAFKALLPPNYNYVDENLSQAVGSVTYSQADNANSRTVGLVTGSKVKVLETGWAYTFLQTVNYYDDKLRLIQSISDNYKSGYDRVTNLFDFSGKTLQSKTTHSQSDLTWKDLVETRLEGNKVIRLGGGNSWTSGAASVEVLPPNTDGWMETMAANPWGNRVFGFSSQNNSINPDSVKYGLYIGGGSVYRVYEKGVIKFGGLNFNSYDIFRIERVGASIKYSRNGAVFYTSVVPSTTALLVDVSMYTINDFLSNVRTSFTTTTKSILRRFEYDHAGRLLKTFHQPDGQPEILLAKNEYNELGQLVDKKLHSTQASGSDSRQSVDYRYNIRGWMTSINNATVSNDLLTNNDDNDLFGMNLSYNEAITGLTSTGDTQFNGNISAIQWSSNKSLGTIKSRGYKFAYDALNRLTAATHLEKTSGWNPSAAFHENNLTYDGNGNIKTLNRTDKSGASMDQLGYSYYGNSLLAVTDNANDQTGFKEINFTGNDYVNDSNGNMVRDANKVGNSLLLNGTFDTTQEWVVGGESGRATIQNGEAQITTGASSVTLAQTIPFVLSRTYIVEVEIESATEGSVKVMLGNSSVLVTGTGKKVVTLAPTSTGSFSLEASVGYGGKIKNVSLFAIAYVTYNHLNLPTTVSMSGNDQLRYIYDASGRKLAQEVTDKNFVLKKRSDYVGEYFYENDTLKFINHEEGRIVMTGPSLEYQYNLKDHLGNVRLTFTTKPNTEIFTANGEFANQPTESNTFNNYSPVDRPLFNHTQGTNSKYTQLLHGGHNSQVAWTKSLSVMPGDTIKAGVWAKYQHVDNPGSGLTGFASALTSAFGLNAQMVGDPGTAYSSLNNYGTVIAEGLDHSEDETAPKAFINILLFDRDHNFVDAAYSQIGINDKQRTNQQVKDPHGYLAISKLVTTPGYAYIFLSNENPVQVDVFFDDLKIEQVKSPVVQMDDYYPFGLTFNSYNRESSTAQNFKYNGVENEDELDLNINTTFFRMHDPALGRWWQIDPKPREDMSPYSAMGNNPMLYSDPMGDTTRIYSTAGKMLKQINDSHENQSHFVNKRQFNKMSQGEDESPDDYASRVRESSVAFIGSNTIKDMQGIVKEANGLGKELGFVGAISGTREIRLTKLPADESNSVRGIGNAQGQVDKKYSSAEQSKLFLYGHVHPKGALVGGFTEAQRAWSLGTPTGVPYAGTQPRAVDFYEKLRDANGNFRPHTGMVATPYGFTMYPTVRFGEPASEISRTSYRFFKAGKVK